MKSLHLSTLMFCSLALLSACDSQQDTYKKMADASNVQAPAAPAPAPVIVPEPVGYADQSLKGQFVRYDLKTLILRANALELGQKKEFEKTETFNERKSEFISSLNKPNGKVALRLYVPDEQAASYDADSERLNIKVPLHGNFERLISYDRSKKFPVAISVTSEDLSNEEWNGLRVYEKITYRVGFKTNREYDLSVSLPLPIDKAQSLKDSISLAVVGTVADPIIMDWVGSEIKHDHVERYTDKTLTLSGVQFWIYDKSTLEVKAKFDSNLKPLK